MKEVDYVKERIERMYNLKIEYVDELEVWGEIYFDPKKIKLKTGLTLSEALHVLAHEVGHWIIHQNGGNSDDENLATSLGEEFIRRHVPEYPDRRRLRSTRRIRRDCREAGINWPFD